MAQLSIRISDELKSQGDELFNSLGLNMSAAVNIFVKQSVRQRGIPFVITEKEDPFFSEENIAYLKKIKNSNNLESRMEQHGLIEASDD